MHGLTLATLPPTPGPARHFDFEKRRSRLDSTLSAQGGGRMTWLSRLLKGAALAAAVTLCLSADAFAGNIAPNPSFTNDCGAGAAPCGWETTRAGSGGVGNRPFSVVTRDTTTFLTSPASMQVTTGPLQSEGARTTPCMTNAVGNGTYSLGFSYRVTDQDVQSIVGLFNFYADNACDPTQANGVVDSILVVVSKPGGPGWDGNWTTVAPVADTITGNPLSWRIVFGINPTGACDASATCFSTANIDDVIANSPFTTAVRVTSLAARRSPAGVNLTWRAPSTVETLGFNVWRSDARGVHFSKLNRSLVLGSGAAYRYRDRTALAGRAYVYKLQLVRPDGSRIWAASIRSNPTRH
jgi:hypothetical protein